MLAVLGVGLNSLHGEGHSATSFGKFYGLSVVAAVHAHSHSCRTAPGPTLWPCGLPYPEAEDLHLPVAVPSSRRRAQRWRRSWAIRRLVNAAVCGYSWLASGCPAGGPRVAAASQRLSVVQWELVGHIEERVREAAPAHEWSWLAAVQRS